jgi:hypothetical protein
MIVTLKMYTFCQTLILNTWVLIAKAQRRLGEFNLVEFEAPKNIAFLLVVIETLKNG